MGDKGGTLIALITLRMLHVHTILVKRANYSLCLIPVEQEGEGWPENVEVKYILIYTALDPTNTDDFNGIVEWLV